MSTGSTTIETGARRFSRHVAITLGARVVISASSMLAGVIVARWLGADSLGMLASLSVMTLLAINFGSLGLPSAITYMIARDRGKLKPVILSSVIFAICIGSISALVISSIVLLKPGLFGDIPVQLVTIAAVAIPFQMLMTFCLAILLGRGEIRRYNLFDVMVQVFALINPVVVLGLIGLGIFAIVALNAAAAVIFSFIVLILLARTALAESAAEKMHFDKPLILQMLGYGWKFYIAMAAGAVIFRADLLIVNYFRGAAEAGVYAVSTQVGTLLMLLPNVISTVLFPKATEASDATGEMTCRVSRHTSFIMLLLCLAAVPLSFLLPILYGSGFTGVPIQVLILLPGVYLLGLEAVQVQYFNSLGLSRVIPVFWIITMAVNITLDLVFVPSFGAVAAAVVSTVSYSLMFFLVAVYFRSRTGRSFADAYIVRGPELRSLLHFGRSLNQLNEGNA